MSVLTVEPGQGTALSNWLSDGLVVTKRNVLGLFREPEVIVFAVIQPIMFIVLFSQVYSGSISVPGVDYTQFMMAGIFSQTVIFGSTFSGSFMAQDLKKGMIDRFRTLPMSSSAVLVGRTNADLVLNSISLTVMIFAGFLVGWRPAGGLGNFFVAVLLLLLFSYAFSWVMSTLGMMVRSPEVINNAGFMILFPITFISNAFVPSQNLPGPLKWFAESVNPVSALTQASRELFGNIGDLTTSDTWLMQNPVEAVLIGIVVMLLVFVPLAINRYKAISSR